MYIHINIYKTKKIKYITLAIHFNNIYLCSLIYIILVIRYKKKFKPNKIDLATNYYIKKKNNYRILNK